MTKTSSVSSSANHGSPSPSGESAGPSLRVVEDKENKAMKASSMGPSPTELLAAEEMKELLSKLQELVPNIPRHKKLSKLEIIQYVIDYIFDLQTALETHPAASLVCEASRHHMMSSMPSPPKIRRGW